MTETLARPATLHFPQDMVLTRGAVKRLEQAAKARGRPVWFVVQDLVEKVALDDLIDAVLDDAS